MEKGFEVNEFWRVVLVELVKILQNFLLHVLDEFRFIPEFIEPGFQVTAVACAVHLQIQFDVVVARAKAQSADCEIGTAQDGFLHAGISDVIHLAVQELCVPNGTDFHFLAYPVGTIAGDALLLQDVGELQTGAINDEGFLFRFVGVERCDETRLAKEEIEMLDLVELVLEGFVGVNCKVGGNDREPRAGLQLGLEKISNIATSVVVSDARVYRGGWHFTDFSHKPCGFASIVRRTRL